MGKGGYKIFDQRGMYFVSFAVVSWVDVFTRQEYRDILIESLKHCQQEQRLVVYGWCVMSNHMHLIISAKENNVSDVLGNFKKFTSKKIVDAIQNNASESRKQWMLKIFKEAGEFNSRNTNYQFWNQDNEPKIIYTPEFAAQKLAYIHNNPVDSGIVEKAEEYIYSSARDHFRGSCLTKHFFIIFIL